MGIADGLCGGRIQGFPVSSGVVMVFQTTQSLGNWFFPPAITPDSFPEASHLAKLTNCHHEQVQHLPCLLRCELFQHVICIG